MNKIGFKTEAQKEQTTSIEQVENVNTEEVEQIPISPAHYNLKMSIDSLNNIICSEGFKDLEAESKQNMLNQLSMFVSLDTELSLKSK